MGISLGVLDNLAFCSLRSERGSIVTHIGCVRVSFGVLVGSVDLHGCHEPHLRGAPYLLELDGSTPDQSSKPCQLLSKRNGEIVEKPFGFPN